MGEGGWKFPENLNKRGGWNSRGGWRISLIIIAMGEFHN